MTLTPKKQEGYWFDNNGYAPMNKEARPVLEQKTAYEKSFLFGSEHKNQRFTRSGNLYEVLSNYLAKAKDSPTPVNESNNKKELSDLSDQGLGM